MSGAHSRSKAATSPCSAMSTTTNQTLHKTRKRQRIVTWREQGVLEGALTPGEALGKVVGLELQQRQIDHAAGFAA